MASDTSLTFNSSQSLSDGDSVCLQIDIIDDDIYEEDQQFSVSIAAVTPNLVAVIGENNSVTMTIQDSNGI